MIQRLALYYKNRETIWSQFPKEEIQMFNFTIIQNHSHYKFKMG